MTKPKQIRNFFFLVIVLLAAFLIRFVHLDADTPKGVSDNIGIYVDEGYKTLAPRNLILFGESKWHASDSYSGWLARSSLTQWSFYTGFKLWGVNIRSARLVAVFAFIAFLATAYWHYQARDDGYYGLIAIVVLGLQSTLFFYSRVALFEIFIVAIIYPSIFYVDRIFPQKKMQAILILTGLSIAAVKLVKMSAIIYYLPSFLALFLLWFFLHRENKINYQNLAFIAIGIIFLAIGASLSINMIQSRFAFSAKTIVKNIANTEMASHSFSFAMLGYLAALHMLLAKPQEVLHSFYRLSLLTMVIICPLLLALFTYNPLRYYIPILPAHLLLFVEWLRLKTYRCQCPVKLQPFTILISIPLLFMVCITGANVLNALLKALSIQLGDTPGLSDPTMAKLVFPMALIAAMGLIVTRKYLLSQTILNALIIACLALAIVINTYRISHFHMNPVYQSDQIQKSIAKIVGPNEVVAGDWAPFFTINTGLRSIYMNDVFNQKSAEVIKPNYILASNNRNSRINLDRMRSITGVRLGESVYSDTYVGKTIDLIPIRYDARAQ